MITSSVLVIPRAVLAAVERAAEAAYPEEACGLLAGRRDGPGGLVVTGFRPSANVATTDRRETFEVDPAVRFALMREIEGTGAEIVGHYHSHPDHPPVPSAQDLEHAYEPDLVWLITTVAEGKAGMTRGFAVAPDGSCFIAIEIALGP
ncbi:MAG: M67 family metallopeptidase [Pseudomonadota bacterium]